MRRDSWNSPYYDDKRISQDPRNLPGEERVALLRRGVSPDETCPRWLKCGCGKGGAIQYVWGQASYCEKCGNLL